MFSTGCCSPSLALTVVVCLFFEWPPNILFALSILFAKWVDWCSAIPEGYRRSPMPWSRIGAALGIWSRCLLHVYIATSTNDCTLLLLGFWSDAERSRDKQICCWLSTEREALWLVARVFKRRNRKWKIWPWLFHGAIVATELACLPPIAEPWRPKTQKRAHYIFQQLW